MHTQQTDRTFETAGKKNDAYLQRNLIYVSNVCICVYMCICRNNIKQSLVIPFTILKEITVNLKILYLAKIFLKI